MHSSSFLAFSLPILALALCAVAAAVPKRDLMADIVSSLDAQISRGGLPSVKILANSPTVSTVWTTANSASTQYMIIATNLIGQVIVAPQPTTSTSTSTSWTTATQTAPSTTTTQFTTVSTSSSGDSMSASPPTTSTSGTTTSTPMSPSTTSMTTTTSSGASSGAISTTTTTSTSVRMSTTTAQASTTSTSLPMPTGPIVAAYFPDWNLNVLSPEQINYSKYDFIDFAFAIPDQNFQLQFTQYDSATTLKKLVKYAHGNGTMVGVSIGGWTGSKYFSKAVSSSSNRGIFVNNIVKMVQAYNLDGIDIDWEYPGQAGNGGNIVSSSDSANMLSFLKMLRSALGKNKRISAAVTDFPFAGSNGSPLSDVTAFGQVLDNVLIMNYDVWGSSSNPGPNAPFSNACGKTGQPGVNMIDSIKTWSNAGFPKKKLLMGLPAYGYINWSSKTSLISRHRARRSSSSSSRSDNSIPTLGELLEGSQQSEQRFERRFERYIRQVQARDLGRHVAPSTESTSSTLAERALSGATILDDLVEPHLLRRLTKRQASCPNPEVQCQASELNGFHPEPISNETIPVTEPVSPPIVDIDDGGNQIKISTNGDLSKYSGSQIQFTDMISWGLLTRSSSTTSGFTSRNGYVMAWDKCSSTPFLYNTLRKTVITYDDPQSIAIKAAYALSAGIGGTNMWEMTGDYNYVLTDSTRTAFGKST